MKWDKKIIKEALLENFVAFGFDVRDARNEVEIDMYEDLMTPEDQAILDEVHQSLSDRGAYKDLEEVIKRVIKSFARQYMI